MNWFNAIKLGFENERLKSKIRDLKSTIELCKAITDACYDIITQQTQLIESMKTKTTIFLKRTYHPNGTNGTLYINDNEIAHTIELPWRDNKFRISCIPEGTYRIRKRTSTRFGDHIYVEKVPNRSAILFHPANNAIKELMGCIAPVTKLTGPGTGTQSVLAMGKLRSIVYGHIDAGKEVYLEITGLNSKNEIG